MPVDKYGHELKLIDLTACKNTAPDLYEVYRLFCDSPNEDASVDEVREFFFTLKMLMEHERSVQRLESR